MDSRFVSHVGGEDGRPNLGNRQTPKITDELAHGAARRTCGWAPGGWVDMWKAEESLLPDVEMECPAHSLDRIDGSWSCFFRAGHNQLDMVDCCTARLFRCLS